MNRYFRELSVTAALGVVLLALAIFAPAFFQPQPLLSLVTREAPTLVVACGMALVIICREIDISVASTAARIPGVTATSTVYGGEFEIRRAVEADVPAIVALLADDPLGATREATADLAPYLEAFAAIDGDPSELLVVLADDTEAIGTMQLSFLPGLSRNGATRAQIEAVRVKDGHRGEGLGEQLVEWALDEARRRR